MPPHRLAYATTTRHGRPVHGGGRRGSQSLRGRQRSAITISEHAPSTMTAATVSQTRCHNSVMTGRPRESRRGCRRAPRRPRAPARGGRGAGGGRAGRAKSRARAAAPSARRGRWSCEEAPTPPTPQGGIRQHSARRRLTGKRPIAPAGLGGRGELGDPYASHQTITKVSPLTGAVVKAVTVISGVAALLLAVMSVAWPRSAVVVVLASKITMRPLNWSATAPEGAQADVTMFVVVDAAPTVQRTIASADRWRAATPFVDPLIAPRFESIRPPTSAAGIRPSSVVPVSTRIAAVSTLTAAMSALTLAPAGGPSFGCMSAVSVRIASRSNPPASLIANPPAASAAAFGSAVSPYRTVSC